MGWRQAKCPDSTRAARGRQACHFARAAWNGMVNAALMLSSLMQRTEAGNDAILQSACAVLATGHLRNISLRSDDLDLVGRADHTGCALTLAGLADLETGSAHSCHRGRRLGLVQGGKGALEGWRRRAGGVRFAA